MELRQYLVLLRKWAWLLIIGALLAGGASYYVGRQAPKVYQATITLLVTQAANPLNPTYNDAYGSAQLMQTYAQMVGRRSVTDEVDRRLGSTEGSASGISAQIIRDTQLMEISVTNLDPVAAQKVANMVGEVFVDQIRSMQVGQSEGTRRTVQDQIAAVQQDMQRTTTQIDTIRNAQDGRSEAQKSADINSLQGLLAQYQNSYANLVRTDQEMALSESAASNSVRVTEPARDPGYLIPSRTMQNTLLAAVVGLMLAAGIAFLIEYLDDSIKSAEMVEAVTGLTTAGYVTRIPHKRDEDVLVVAKHSRSPLAEAYRTLRTNIQFAGIEKRISPLLVTSSNPGEGKTTTVANLAACMAQAGQRVVMIDADLRKPALHRLFGLTNRVGLTNILLDERTLGEDVIQPTGIPNLWLIASGPLPPNPAELLSTKRLDNFLEKLKSYADVICIDAPPLLAVTDPSVLATKAGSTLLVVDWGKTRKDAVKRAVQALKAVGVKPLCAVGNKLSPKSEGHYYYRHYYADAEAPASGNGHKPAKEVAAAKQK